MNEQFTRAFNLLGSKKYPILGFTFPAPLSRSLIAAGYNRCTITVREDGILLQPYVAHGDEQGHKTTVDLPDWNGKADP